MGVYADSIGNQDSAWSIEIEGPGRQFRRLQRGLSLSSTRGERARHILHSAEGDAIRGGEEDEESGPEGEQGAVRPYEGRGRLRSIREEGGGEARVDIPAAGRPPGLCHSPSLE